MAEEYSHEKVIESYDYLKKIIKENPEVGIICGSGLSGLGEDVENKIIVKYGDIPNFMTSTVQGHKGQLVFGRLGGKKVMCMQGRFHPYEGHEAWKIAVPLRVMKLLGVEFVIITNAAGGLNRSFGVGDFMLIKDHISFPGLGGYNPLWGKNDDKFGPRFPAVTQAYDKNLRKLMYDTAVDLGIKDTMREGIYFNVAGPSYETIAELNLALKLGGDAIGMSTAQEVVAAAHCGLKVCACSLITNYCIIDYESTEAANHEEVLETGRARAAAMQKLVTEFLKRCP
uniref:purine nucleoside phosphorylase-like n=1 Tax=Styela clava TaxID=7725 RepID=UPI00193A71FF|nr:purine nucleoside phosphorylase-like [Styela clava]